MDSELLVSVIIPSYNRPYFLRHRSIPSVLRQTYQNWELIVVGDGPADSQIRRAAQSFNDPRIRYVEIQRPDYSRFSPQELWYAAGASARNQGLKEARGQIIAPLDDDDEFFDDHLLQSVLTMRREGYDFVYGSTIVRSFETGEEKVDYFPWRDESTQRIFQNRNIIYHSSVCYAAEFRDQEYPVDGTVPADYGLWLRIKDAGARFGSLDDPQNVFYDDSGHGGVRLSVPSLPPLAEFEHSVKEIYQSRMVSNQGPYCRAFEKAVAEYLDVPHAIAAPSGDVALMIAFQALRIHSPERRQVILPSYTHPSTANAAIWSGFEIIFCDIDPASLCLTPATVEPHLNSNTAAIAAVHPHGNPCDVEALLELAHQHGALLLADAAAAFGAKLNGKRIGSFGDLEVFSFSGTKVLTTGEGGMVCTPHKQFADIINVVGRYGITTNYFRTSLGVNGKLAEIPAALGMAGLPYVDEWITDRQASSRLYREQLDGVASLRFQEPINSTSAGTAKDFPIILSSPEEAERVERALAAHGIQTRPYYRPLHRMPSYGGTAGRLQETEKIGDCVLCVPCYGGLRREVIDLVCGVIRATINL